MKHRLQRKKNLEQFIGMVASLFTMWLDPEDNRVLSETSQFDGYLHYPNYISLLYP